MCQKCIAHATRQMMYALCTLPPEQEWHGINFVLDMMTDLIELDFDFDALEAKIKLDIGEVAGHA